MSTPSRDASLLLGAVAVLRGNATGAPGTFVHALHEESRIDSAALDQLLTAARDVQGGPMDDSLAAEGAALRGRVGAIVWRYLAAHHDPDDGFRIIGMGPGGYGVLVDRLNAAFD